MAQTRQTVEIVVPPPSTSYLSPLSHRATVESFSTVEPPQPFFSNEIISSSDRFWNWLPPANSPQTRCALCHTLTSWPDSPLCTQEDIASKYCALIASFLVPSNREKRPVRKIAGFEGSSPVEPVRILFSSRGVHPYLSAAPLTYRGGWAVYSPPLFSQSPILRKLKSALDTRSGQAHGLGISSKAILRRNMEIPKSDEFGLKSTPTFTKSFNQKKRYRPYTSIYRCTRRQYSESSIHSYIYDLL